MSVRADSVFFLINQNTVFSLSHLFLKTGRKYHLREIFIDFLMVHGKTKKLSATCTGKEIIIQKISSVTCFTILFAAYL